MFTELSKREIKALAALAAAPASLRDMPDGVGQGTLAALTRRGLLAETVTADGAVLWTITARGRRRLAEAT